MSALYGCEYADSCSGRFTLGLFLITYDVAWAPEPLWTW